MKFPEYLEKLAKEHSMIKHSDDECHFSDMTIDQHVIPNHRRIYIGANVSVVNCFEKR